MSEAIIGIIISAVASVIIAVIVNAPGWMGLREVRKKNKADEAKSIADAAKSTADEAEIYNRIALSLITPLETKVNRLLRNQTQLRSDLSRMVSIARHFLVGLYRLSAQLHANNIIPEFSIDPLIEKEMLTIEINANRMSEEELELKVSVIKASVPDVEVTPAQPPLL